MWNHIVIEGICFGTKNGIDKRGPCGKQAPSFFCLENGHCPYLGYTESSGREVALYIPLTLILSDKIEAITVEVWQKLRWYCWNKWFWDDKKFMDYLESHRGECLAWDNAQKRAKDKFQKWFERAKCA